MTPRAGFETGTSGDGIHRPWSARLRHSSIGAWSRSWIRGPVVGK